MKINEIAIVSKLGSKKAEKAVKGIATKLLKQKFKVYTVSPVLVDGAKTVNSLEDLREIKLDLVITFGGDGTTLRAFRNLENETPLLTINVGGNRGIFSEIDLDEIDNAIQHIKKNDVWLDKRTRVVASCNGKQFQPALNEIYVNRKNLTKTAEFEIKFQNDIVKQRMDGVMISTPSGSHDCNIAMDAQVIKSVGFGEIITIKKYKKQAGFVRLKKKGLRQMTKLGF